MQVFLITAVTVLSRNIWMTNIIVMVVLEYSDTCRPYLLAHMLKNSGDSNHVIFEYDFRLLSAIKVWNSSEDSFLNSVFGLFTGLSRSSLMARIVVVPALEHGDFNSVGNDMDRLKLKLEPNAGKSAVISWTGWGLRSYVISVAWGRPTMRVVM